MSDNSLSLIKHNLLKYLKGTIWDDVLFHYIHSDDFDKVLIELQKQSSEGHRFCPTIGTMFKWMKVTPFNTIRCILLLDDTFNHIEHPGIPYIQDMSKMGKIELAESMRERYKGRGSEIRLCSRKEINNLLTGIAPEYEYFDYDLTRWCKQGVLMMPQSPTCRIEGKPHYQIWADFRARMIDIVNQHYPDMIWLLCGKRGRKHEDLIESRYTLPVTLWPQSSNPIWSTQINDLLVSRKEQPIIWD